MTPVEDAGHRVRLAPSIPTLLLVSSLHTQTTLTRMMAQGTPLALDVAQLWLSPLSKLMEQLRISSSQAGVGNSEKP